MPGMVRRAVTMGSMTRTLHVDIENEKELKDVELNEKVTVTAVGTVRMLEASREYDYGDGDKGTFPASLTIELTKIEVNGENEFSLLAAEMEND